MESNYLPHLPPHFLDYTPNFVQLRLGSNPWHCDCAATYLAKWLRNDYIARMGLDDTAMPEFADNFDFSEFGHGVVCRGPSFLGGKLLIKVTVHELCLGEWASMKGLVPRLSIDAF